MSQASLKPQTGRPAAATLHAGSADGVDLAGALSAAKTTAFSWDFRSDQIVWADNAVCVLGLRQIGDVTSGEGYRQRVAPEHASRRLAAMSAAQVSPAEIETGIAYRVQYRFQPRGRRSCEVLLLEEHGTWWPGYDGRVRRVQSVIRVLDEAYLEQQRHIARQETDPLSGLVTRIPLMRALDYALSDALRSGRRLAFLVVSINGLDVINDTFGFDAGDEVISAVGRLIQGQLRGGDTLGRYGSNKFGAIINDCGPGTMRLVADRIISAIRVATITTSVCKLSVTVAAGGVALPEDGASAHEAAIHALQALDMALRTRGDMFVGYEACPALDLARRRNSIISDEVVRALDDDRMMLVLQAMVDAKTRRTDHYECLLRLRRTDGTLVSAGEFMPVAEQLGLSRLIDLRAQALAIDLLRAYPKLKLSLNVSGLTSGDNEWLVCLHRLTGGQRALTERLTIEITETAAIHDLDQSMVFVDTIKELGCKAAIDDFGVGYTNFRNLKLLNVDLVKIDGTFVKNICHDRSDQVFIKSMVELAATFGMQTVAEWVGDAQSAQFLTDAGIDYLQGFHFGQPTDPVTLLGPPLTV